VLFVFHLLFLVFRLQVQSLRTSVSISSGVLGAAGTFAAGFQSFLEDQRSLRPSDILVLYFSACSILYIPMLRSLWLMPSDYVPRALWTVVFVCNTLVVFAESARKSRFIRPLYKGATAEQVAGFWSRSFFIWVLPFFQTGYSKELKLRDIPKADLELQAKSTWKGLDASWNHIHGRHRLLRAAFAANLWSFVSAVAPRLALTAFRFCQPFLVQSSVSYLSAGPEMGQDMYGQGLVGGFLLVYLGIAVSNWTMLCSTCSRTNTFNSDIASSVLTSDKSNDRSSPLWFDCPNISAYDDSTSL
jgi:ATP-binding cassette subfamily C (CFTR/MRP) protein 1